MFRTRLFAAALLAAAFVPTAVAPAQDEGAAPAPAAAVEKVVVRPKLAKGDALWFEEKETVNVDQMGMPMEMATTRVFSITVKEVKEDGHIVTEVKFGRIHGAMDVGGMMQLDYDSEVKAEPVADPMMAQLANVTKMLVAPAHKAFTMTLSPQGRVVSVEGAAKIMGRAGPMQPAATDEAIAVQWRDVLFPLPAEGVAPDLAWKETTKSTQMGLQMTRAHSYTVKDVTEEAVSVDGTSKIEVDTEAATQLGEVEVDEATAGVKARVSRTDGMLLDGEWTFRMTATTQMGEMAVDNKRVVKRTPKPEPKPADDAAGEGEKKDDATDAEPEAPKGD